MNNYRDYVRDPIATNPPVIPNYQRPYTTPPLAKPMPKRDGPSIPVIVVETGSGFIDRAPQSTLARVNRDTFETQLNVSAIDEPIRIIFGAPRIGAAIARALATNYPDEMCIVLLWGAGEIDTVGTVTMRGAALPTGSTITNYRGTQTQAVDSTLVTLFALIGITWTNPLLGVAYSVLTLPLRLPAVPPDYLPGALITIGDFHTVPRGLKCYDPRDGAQSYATPSTWLYTTNPTLCLARLLTDATLGLAMVPDATFWADVTANANLNDVMLGGVEKRHTLNLALEAKQSADDWIKTLALYAGCFVVPEGATYRLIPDAVASSVATYTESNMVEGSFSWKRRDSLQRPNIIYVRYTETAASGNYRPALAPQGADVIAVPAAEKRRAQVIDLPGKIKYSEANRAWIERRNHLYLEDLEMSFTLFDEGLSAQLGDVITVSFGTLFVSKLMRIMGIALSELGRWQISCLEYDPASYNGTVQTAPTYIDSPLPDPFGIPTAVTGLVLSELVSTNDSAASPLSRIQATWTASTWPYVAGYIVTITDAADSPITLLTPYLQPGLTFVSPPLTSPKKYGVSVTAISTTSVSSLPVSSDITLLLTSQVFENVFSQALTSTGWTLGGDVTRSVLVFSSIGGAGLNFFTSPIYDLGSLRLTLISLAVYREQLIINPNKFHAFLFPIDEQGVEAQAVAFDGNTQITARYFKLRVFGSFPIAWTVDLTGGTWLASMPVTAENALVTTSASASVTATLANRYLKITGVQATAQSITQANPSYSLPVIGVLTPNTVNIDCYDSTNTRVVKPCSVTVFGVRGDKTKTDWARTSNGGVATASSSAAGFPGSAAITGDMSTWGSSLGGWASSGALPANLQVDLIGTKLITEIVVVTLRDSFATPNVPTVFDTFTLYGISNFIVEYWTGSAWVAVTGGTVTGNNKVMRRFPISISMSRFRAYISASVDGQARIVSLQAIGAA